MTTPDCKPSCTCGCLHGLVFACTLELYCASLTGYIGCFKDSPAKLCIPATECVASCLNFGQELHQIHRPAFRLQHSLAHPTTKQDLGIWWRRGTFARGSRPPNDSEPVVSGLSQISSQCDPSICAVWLWL